MSRKHSKFKALFCISGPGTSLIREESPLTMNYCPQVERLFCYVQASFVIQYYYQIKCEFDRLYVLWGCEIIQDALKIIFYNVVI